jgi:hypothetical protein
MTEAVGTSETFLNFHQTTLGYNPEDSHLHTRHSKNQKSHLAHTLYFLLFRSKGKVEPQPIMEAHKVEIKFRSLLSSGKN